MRLLLRPTAPPLALGLVVAPVLLAAETGLVYLLMRTTGGNIFGVVFLLGILVVSTVWGLRLGALTTVASAVVYVFFHRLQTPDRVLLVGDTRQHEAVEAGRPYKQLQDAGMQTARLGDIVRQKDPSLKEAVEQLARGIGDSDDSDSYYVRLEVDNKPSAVYQQPPSPSRLDGSLLSYSTLYPSPSRRSQPSEVSYDVRNPP